MGYQTDFELTFDAPGLEEVIYAKLKDISGYIFNDSYIYSAKWYDHDKDMLTLSLAYPDILFTLEGKGEESDDIWISYYQNGKTQYHQAKIVYPEYDPLMMK